MTAMSEPIDWDARLRAAVAETVAKRQGRRDERSAMAERRDHGLAQRHAAKLARKPPCCAETASGTCEQHAQQQRTGREMLRLRRGGAIRLGGDVVPTRPTRGTRRPGEGQAP
jgi:hypothetical protein